jgi:hypothetical protein
MFGTMGGMANDDVTVSITGDEALILFDLLHRWEDDNQSQCATARS